ncbi:uncharacterized protein LOC132707733 isoform X2 [Cylas formicarius]|uniref:uncharacterized protein LOC132707733 isoform X2 n=1 Tax=Cylas formicarius TaxID=197179 RepID=UPI002958D6D0|nr:uncharacterized protein LOC132707733 isoform X2 [Cylas formicarius]
MKARPRCFWSFDGDQLAKLLVHITLKSQKAFVTNIRREQRVTVGALREYGRPVPHHTRSLDGYIADHPTSVGDHGTRGDPNRFIVGRHRAAPQGNDSDIVISAQIIEWKGLPGNQQWPVANVCEIRCTHTTALNFLSSRLDSTSFFLQYS